MFPSPQGGSETLHFQQQFTRNNAVSIPSRRVGDLDYVFGFIADALKFPSPQGGSETVIGSAVGGGD